MGKVRVGLIYGGRSLEHEVSLASAASILRNLDPGRYEVWPIAVDRQGRWRLGELGSPPEVAAARGRPVLLPPDPQLGCLVSAEPDGRDPFSVDVYFPIIHGRGGEDGTLQGLFELCGVPYVGSGVLGSALQMDKEVAKRLLDAAGLPVVPWRAIRRREVLGDGRGAAEGIAQALGLPVFVKPANSGSSVGIQRVERVDELPGALAEAGRYDTKLLVERAVDAREIEVAVLGDREPEVSLPGEIRPHRAFYDYRAKYADEGTELLAPAPLAAVHVARFQSLAAQAYRTLEGAGLARVDFLFERGSDAIFISEVNSLPGFTEVSMYPRLWEVSGLPYPQLLDRLIEQALERHREQADLETTFRCD